MLCFGGLGEGLPRLGGEEEVDSLRMRSHELLAKRAGRERGPRSFHVRCEAGGDDGGLVCGTVNGAVSEEAPKLYATGGLTSQRSVACAAARQPTLSTSVACFLSSQVAR